MTKQGLSFLDRNLTLWIFIAMGLGLAIGVFFPQASVSLNQLSVDNVNIPIAIGLILMMYSPLAKVDYSLLPIAFRDKKVLSLCVATIFHVPLSFSSEIRLYEKEIIKSGKR